MKPFNFVIAVILFTALLTVPVSAHHSRSNFDNSQSVTVEGTVVEFAFSNPHIFIEVAGADGVTWLVEAHSVTGMKRRGWTANMFTAGERVTVTGTPDRNSNKKLMALTNIVKADGAKLQTGGGSGRNREPILPSTDFSGTWGMDMRSFDVRAAGGPPPSNWPYTEEGARQAAAYDPEDSPELFCKEIGVPRIIVYPYSINFNRTDKRLNVHKEHLNEYRTIWFDADDAKAANEEPSPTGTSIGKLVSEKELHIITDNFIPTEWGVENALDSSEQKRVEEIYKLSEDGLRIDVKMSITDPVLFTDEIIRTLSFNKESNREFEVLPCDPRAADRHISMIQTGDESSVKSKPKASGKSWWARLMGKG